jgi:hypothetical protein
MFIQEPKGTVNESEMDVIRSVSNFYMSSPKAVTFNLREHKQQNTF